MSVLNGPHGFSVDHSLPACDHRVFDTEASGP